MCLSTISDESPKPKGFGYKVMHQVMRRSKNKRDPYRWVEVRGHVYTPVYYNKRALKVGKWYTASAFPEFIQAKFRHDDKGYELPLRKRHYRTGFHIFETKAAARQYDRFHDIWRIEYDKAHTLGTQDGKVVIVAKRMRVVECVFRSKNGY